MWGIRLCEKPDFLPKQNVNVCLNTLFLKLIAYFCHEKQSFYNNYELFEENTADALLGRKHTDDDGATGGARKT